MKRVCIIASAAVLTLCGCSVSPTNTTADNSPASVPGASYGVMYGSGNRSEDSPATTAATNTSAADSTTESAASDQRGGVMYGSGN